MKIDYRIEPNPHATEANEYITIAISKDYPKYSYTSFFNLSDTEISIEWMDWGSLDCEECNEDFIDKFNSSLHDGSAKSLVEHFINERIQENKKLAKL